jgi:hypothetical protein
MMYTCGIGVGPINVWKKCQFILYRIEVGYQRDQDKHESAVHLPYRRMSKCATIG